LICVSACFISAIGLLECTPEICYSMTGFRVHEAKTIQEIRESYPVINELYPEFSEAEFIQRVTFQRLEGYRLVYIKEEDGIVSCLGFRSRNVLFSGKTLYVEDLATLTSAQRKGYGSCLMDWVIQYAKDEDCKAVALDSGPHMLVAHRLYINKGFRIFNYHFHKKLE